MNWSRGERNNYLTKVAAKLSEIGICSAACHAALRVENVNVCIPPMMAVDVRCIMDMALEVVVV